MSVNRKASLTDVVINKSSNLKPPPNTVEQTKIPNKQPFIESQKEPDSVIINYVRQLNNNKCYHQPRQSCRANCQTNKPGRVHHFIRASNTISDHDYTNMYVKDPRSNVKMTLPQSAKVIELNKFDSLDCLNCTQFMIIHGCLESHHTLVDDTFICVKVGRRQCDGLKKKWPLHYKTCIDYTK
jgi:hypothetical protein